MNFKNMYMYKHRFYRNEHVTILEESNYLRISNKNYYMNRFTNFSSLNL